MSSLRAELASLSTGLVFATSPGTAGISVGMGMDGGARTFAGGEGVDARELRAGEFYYSAVSSVG